MSGVSYWGVVRFALDEWFQRGALIGTGFLKEVFMSGDTTQPIPSAGLGQALSLSKEWGKIFRHEFHEWHEFFPLRSPRLRVKLLKLFFFVVEVVILVFEVVFIFILVVVFIILKRLFKSPIKFDGG